MPLTGLVTGARGYGMFGASGPSGAYDSIASVVVGTGQTSVTFSNIPQTYVALQIRILAANTFTAGVGIAMRFNGIGSGYTEHSIQGDGSSATAQGSTGASNIFCGFTANATSTFGASIIDIYDYASTTRNKTVRSIGAWDENGSGQIRSFSSLFNNTSAVTSIVIGTGDNINWLHRTLTAGSTFSLYGIRSA